MKQLVLFLPLLMASILPASPVLQAMIIVSLLSLFLGVAIVVVFRFFAVESDPREAELTEMLPGANCGGCGYSGCSGYAVALAAGEDKDCTRCGVGGQETAEALSAYLGLSVGNFVVRAARVACQGDSSHVVSNYNYNGSTSCKAANSLYSGPFSCRSGCMGFGDCVAVCEYGALSIVDGLARVDADRCVACGACVGVCPRHIISLQPKYVNLYQVRCMNPCAGGEVRKVCSIGCIGCTLCVKKCPAGAIHMDGKLAVIDPNLCTYCGNCETVCPSGAITAGLGNAVVDKKDRPQVAANQSN